MAMAKEEGMEASAPLQAGADPTPLSDSLPAFFPTISRAPASAEPRPVRKLNGSDDLLTRLRLVPLYNATVKQFLRNQGEKSGAPGSTTAAPATSAGAGSAAAAAASGPDASQPAGSGIHATGAAGNAADRGTKRPREDEAFAFGKDGTTSGAAKRKGMPKTIENYVADLPGRVMPPKKSLSKADYHEHTMREIIYRPETTIQNIVPFDRETLESAFRVSAGEIPAMDLSLLDSEQTEMSSPRKKRKHKTKQKSQGKG